MEKHLSLETEPIDVARTSALPDALKYQGHRIGRVGSLDGLSGAQPSVQRGPGQLAGVEAAGKGMRLPAVAWSVLERRTRRLLLERVHYDGAAAELSHDPMQQLSRGKAALPFSSARSQINRDTLAVSFTDKT